MVLLSKIIMYERIISNNLKFIIMFGIVSKMILQIITWQRAFFPKWTKDIRCSNQNCPIKERNVIQPKNSSE